MRRESELIEEYELPDLDSLEDGMFWQCPECRASVICLIDHCPHCEAS